MGPYSLIILSNNLKFGRFVQCRALRTTTPAPTVALRFRSRYEDDDIIFFGSGPSLLDRFGIVTVFMLRAAEPRTKWAAIPMYVPISVHGTYIVESGQSFKC